jgi:hypothetical protein
MANQTPAVVMDKYVLSLCIFLGAHTDMHPAVRVTQSSVCHPERSSVNCAILSFQGLPAMTRPRSSSLQPLQPKVPPAALQVVQADLAAATMLRCCQEREVLRILTTLSATRLWLRPVALDMVSTTPSAMDRLRTGYVQETP